jgi:hypothetical protein
LAEEVVGINGTLFLVSVFRLDEQRIKETKIAVLNEEIVVKSHTIPHLQTVCPPDSIHFTSNGQVAELPMQARGPMNDT